MHASLSLALTVSTGSSMLSFMHQISVNLVDIASAKNASVMYCKALLTMKKGNIVFVVERPALHLAITFWDKRRGLIEARVSALKLVNRHAKIKCKVRTGLRGRYSVLKSVLNLYQANKISATRTWLG